MSIPQPYYYPKKKSKTNFAFLIAMIVGIFVAFYLLIHLLALYGEDGGWAFDHEESHRLQEAGSKSQQAERLINVHPTAYPKISDDDRYLAYFPHSGFHNQRISLENALVLAKMLNRTLMIPPVLLGHAVPWLEFDKLYPRVNEATKYGILHCRDIKENELPIECLRFFDYTLVSWDMLIDLDRISQDVRIVDRWEQTYDYLKEQYDIGVEDIYFVKEKKQYQYRLYDNPDGELPTDIQYLSKLDIDELAEKSQDHKLLHIGTLFGSTRLKLEYPKNIKLKQLIRSRTVFKNAMLDVIADKIADRLGGRGNYYGLHLRMTDGVFLDNAEVNSLQIFQDLLKLAGIEETELGIHEPEGSPRGLTRREFMEKCHGKLHTAAHLQALNTPLFIATDVPSPRSNPLLRRFFEAFPCSFVLGDFWSYLDDIQGLVNRDDKVPLTPYLIPFLDAMVAGRAGTDRFLGTPKSTFSGFIIRQLGRVYMGLPVLSTPEEER